MQQMIQDAIAATMKPRDPDAVARMDAIIARVSAAANRPEGDSL
jgi:hypothetical protein